jgi:hypothetical protein
MERAVAKRGADFRYPRLDQDPGGFYVRSASGNGQPSYSTLNGIPTCIVGCAMHEAGMTVPGHTERGSAQAVLMNKVPDHVALAARVAQIHQDYNNPWGEALAMYRGALAYLDEQPKQVIDRSTWGYNANSLYTKAAERIGLAVPYRVRMQMGHYSSLTAGGWVKPSDVIAFDELSAFTKAAEELKETTKKVAASIDALIEAPKPTEKVYPTSTGGFANGGIVKGGVISDLVSNYYITQSGVTYNLTSPAAYEWVGTMKKEHALTA